MIFSDLIIESLRLSILLNKKKKCKPTKLCIIFWLTWFGESNHENISVSDLKALQTVDVVGGEFQGVVHGKYAPLVGEKCVPQQFVLLLRHV